MHNRLLQYGPVCSNGNIKKPATCWSCSYSYSYSTVLVIVIVIVIVADKNTCLTEARRHNELGGAWPSAVFFQRDVYDRHCNTAILLFKKPRWWLALSDGRAVLKGARVTQLAFNRFRTVDRLHAGYVCLPQVSSVNVRVKHIRTEF